MIVLEPLPYPEGALYPHINEQTVKIHYNHHHATYVKKLNQLLRGTVFENEKSVENIIRNVPMDSDLYNMACQVYNHDFYWKSMTPVTKSKLSSRLYNYISDTSEPYYLHAQFNEIVKGSFGSGWIWLVELSNKKLDWMFTKNADNFVGRNPIRSATGVKVLAVCDIWEHAYYTEFSWNREHYLNAFWSVINWTFVEKNLFGDI